MTSSRTNDAQSNHGRRSNPRTPPLINVAITQQQEPVMRCACRGCEKDVGTLGSV